MSRKELERAYFQLGSELEKHYPELSFQNHCYWRIALDQVVQTRWDGILNRPAYRHLSSEKLKAVINLLKSYKSDKSLLLKHNSESLNFRK